MTDAELDALYSKAIISALEALAALLRATTSILQQLEPQLTKSKERDHGETR